jgi:hypothetical protein
MLHCDFALRAGLRNCHVLGVFSACTSRPVFLPEIIKDSVFVFIVVSFRQIYYHHHQHIPDDDDDDVYRLISSPLVCLNPTYGIF